MMKTWSMKGHTPTFMDHQLLKARENATKGELDIIYRKLSLTLQTDNKDGATLACQWCHLHAWITVAFFQCNHMNFRIGSWGCS